MPRVLFVSLLVIAAFAGVLVSALNFTRVEIELAFVRINTPIGVALVSAFTLGLLAGVLWRVRWVAQLLGERGRLRRELRQAELRGKQADAPPSDPAN